MSLCLSAVELAALEAQYTRRYLERNPTETETRSASPSHADDSNPTVRAALVRTTLGKMLKNEALSHASGIGDNEAVLRFIADGADVNAVGTTLTPPLHMAVVHGCSSTVEILLAHGADPGLGDKFGVTALHLAARSGCGMEAMLNFTHNHSPEIQDSKETPLHVAAEVGNIEAIQSLVSAGADINVRSGLGETPLHSATNHRRLAAVRELLRQGADVNAINDLCNTALHRAARKGHFDIVWTLLANQADPSLRSSSGKLALDHAVHGGHQGVVELLHHPNETFTQL